MEDRYHIWKTAIGITRWIGSPTSIAIHTVIFIASFIAAAEGLIVFQDMLLILTTIVSLEAIYLAIFIQMTINYTTQELREVGEDIEEIQEDIGEIQGDVDELQEDVEELGEEDTSEDAAEERRKLEQKDTLESIESDLHKLIKDIEHLKSTSKPKDVNSMFQKRPGSQSGSGTAS